MPGVAPDMRVDTAKFLREGGAAGVALFIGGAMVIMIFTIGAFGPRTRHMALEEIAR